MNIKIAIRVEDLIFSDVYENGVIFPQFFLKVLYHKKVH